MILRVARFFPEPDDDDEVRAAYPDANMKANEYLYRRVDIEDVVSAHLLALERAPAIGFARYIVCATSPFTRDDAAALAVDAPSVVAGAFPIRQWSTPAAVGRCSPASIASMSTPGPVPTSAGNRATTSGHVLDRLKADEDPRSALAREVGSKGYDASRG